MDFNTEKEALNLEMRSYLDLAKNGKLTVEDADKKIQEVRAKKMDIEKLEAQSKVEMETRSTGNWSEIKNALMEKRAITQNGAGAVNVVREIVKTFVDANKLGSRISKFMGESASTVVPVFSPHLARPAGSAEGATGLSADSTAVLGAKTLTLKPYISPLSISGIALKSTAIESELPSIFATAYAGAIDYQVLVGSGTGNDGLGVFIANAGGVSTAQDIACAGAGNPKIADIVKLAINVLGSTSSPENACIVMHPTIFSGVLADATAGNDPYKYQLITQSIMGIPIVLSSYALTTLTAGSYVAVGGDFSKYAMAYASELDISPIKAVGTADTVFQAVQYMNFAPILGSAFYRLKTV